MKKYNNFILEGKIEDIRLKYQDDIPNYILNFFIHNLVDYLNSKSVFLEKMIKLYVDNKDKKQYEKVNLHQQIFNLVRLFYTKKDHLKVKDISQIKDLNHLKNVLQKDIETPPNSKIYLDGDEYLIFSPYDFETARDYGDQSWCTNRDPAQFYGVTHKASFGGIIQCINKFDFNKNLAIEIINILDYVNGINGIMEIAIWDTRDETIYEGTLNELSNEFNDDNIDPMVIQLKPILNYNLIEIIEVLSDIEKNGIDISNFDATLMDELKENFSCTVAEFLTFLRDVERYSSLDYFIQKYIDDANLNILNKMKQYIINSKDKRYSELKKYLLDEGEIYYISSILLKIQSFFKSNDDYSEKFDMFIEMVEEIDENPITEYVLYQIDLENFDEWQFFTQQINRE